MEFYITSKSLSDYHIKQVILLPNLFVRFFESKFSKKSQFMRIYDLRCKFDSQICPDYDFLMKEYCYFFMKNKFFVNFDSFAFVELYFFNAQRFYIFQYKE